MRTRLLTLPPLAPAAGPLALARDILGKDDAPFFVLNSDVTCSYPFSELRDFHMAHGGEGTLMASPSRVSSCLSAGY